MTDEERFEVAMDIIEKELIRLYNETKPEYVYVVTRSEEHADYVEKCFLDENKAQKYCEEFNKNENEYSRDITKIKMTL